MPLLALIVLWVILSLVAAPIIGALFVSRHCSEDRRHGMDLHGRVKEPRTRGKEPLGPGGERRRDRLDLLETPRARRERYLCAAGEARETATQATDESLRERYLKLENVWLTLAAQIEPGAD
jgi:hypothetical protein